MAGKFHGGGDSAMSKGRPSDSSISYTPGGRVPDRVYPAPGNYNPKNESPAMLAFKDPRPEDPEMKKYREEMGIEKPKNTWDPREAHKDMPMVSPKRSKK